MGKKRNIDQTYYNTLDSHIKVDRMFLQNILDVLVKRKNGIHKKALISQLDNMINKNKADIWIKEENSTLNHLLSS